MRDQDIIALLKIDLQISVSAYDALLQGFVDTARAAIEAEGIMLDSASASDGMLVEQYAAWLARKRKENIGMSRMLRWQLHNRLLQEKIGKGD